MTAASPDTQAEAQIRQLIADRDRALGRKDLDGVMAHYAAELVLFDVKPPFQVNGANALRHIWEVCLPYFPDSFGTDTRDLNVTVRGDLAVVHGLWRFTGMPEDHPAQTWIRSTVVCMRDQGRWQIVHEHASLPFDPETLRVVFTLEP